MPPWCNLVWGQTPVASLAPVILNDARDTYPLGAEVEQLDDPGGVLTIAEVSSGAASARFRPHTSESFNLGLAESVSWFRFRLHNSSAQNVEWILEVSNPRLNNVSLYVFRSDSTARVWRSGNSVPYDEWPVDFRNPAFAFRLRQNMETTCYLRVDNRGASRFNVGLYTERAFHRHALRIEIAWGFFYGAVVCLLLHNAVLMVALRDRTYFYCFVLILSFLFYQASMNGTAFQWFWPSSTWWADRSIIFFYGMTFFFGLIFSRSFLELHKQRSTADKLIVGLMIVCLTIAIGALGSHLAANFAAHVLATLGPFIMAAIAAHCWASGYKPARVMMLAWLTYSLGSFYTVLATMRILPQTISTEYAIPLGFTLTLLLFALALADRIRTVELEYKAMLNRTVEERTRELTVAREDIKKLAELMPICSSCKKIRDDKGYWNQLESYLLKHTDLVFSHSICPDCAKELYPEHYRDM